MIIIHIRIMVILNGVSIIINISLFTIYLSICLSVYNIAIIIVLNYTYIIIYIIDLMISIQTSLSVIILTEPHRYLLRYP